MVVIGVAGGAAAYQEHRSRTSTFFDEACLGGSPTHHDRSRSHSDDIDARPEGGTRADTRRLSFVSTQDWNKLLKSAGLEPDEVAPDVLWTDSLAWNTILASMIGANALIIGLETDLNRDTSGGHNVWKVIEYGFLAFWLFDIGVRMLNESWQYFFNLWNGLDMFLVALNIFEVLIMPLAFGDNQEKVGIVRVLRILRILRLLRLVKTIPHCKELWLIICGFVEALRTLGWVLLLLFIVVYAGSIIMTNIVGHQCDEDYSSWSECQDIFGSVFSSMFSLFQVITMESWSMLIARHVLKKKPLLFIFFLIFLMLTTFGLLNIIVGVIVENTLKMSNDEQAKEQQQRKRRMFDEMLELRGVFEEADEDSNGNVDMDEFSAIMLKKDVREKLLRFDIPSDNPSQLFEMLDADEGGSLNIFEFIDGISRLKGQPKATDMRAACMQAKNTTVHLDRLEENFKNLLEGTSFSLADKLVLQDPQDRTTKKGRDPSSSPAWGGSERDDGSEHEDHCGPHTPKEILALDSVVLTPPPSPEPGSSSIDARGSRPLTLPGVGARQLRPLDLGTDREVQILSSQLLAWEPESANGRLRELGRPFSEENGVDLATLAQGSKRAAHSRWMERSRTQSSEFKDKSSAQILRERVNDVEQTVGKRLGSLEQTARQLARSQRQLQKDLNKVLRQRSG